MGRTARLGVATVVFGLCIGALWWLVQGFLLSSPGTVDFTQDHAAGQPVNMTIQTVGSIGFGAHPTWVSYLVQNPSGQWVHSTLWQLPAHTRINVTVQQYDGGGALRNQVLGKVTGTIGDYMFINGVKTYQINSNVADGVGHTFTVPVLGINVPLKANNNNAPLCAVAPCTLSAPHRIVKFSFMTPGPGNYPWQCFLPCGLGFLYGNGGPMQSINYMDGFLKVVA
jgi:hypothetical protein